MDLLSRRALRPMVISAAMGALALVLPVVFHSVGLGSRFLPMFLPLLLNGFLVPPRWAALTGFVIPWLSAFATGMPPLYPPIAAVMSAEGATLGLAAAILSRRAPLWISLPATICAGRAVTFLLSRALAAAFDLPPLFASVAILIQGLPGVALQITVIPLALRAIQARGGILISGGAHHEA